MYSGCMTRFPYETTFFAKIFITMTCLCVFRAHRQLSVRCCFSRCCSREFVFHAFQFLLLLLNSFKTQHFGNGFCCWPLCHSHTSIPARTLVLLHSLKRNPHVNSLRHIASENNKTKKKNNHRIHIAFCLTHFAIRLPPLLIIRRLHFFYAHLIPFRICLGSLVNLFLILLLILIIALFFDFWLLEP